jgi:hypothetical protein
MEYVYSTHKSAMAAIAACDDYCATGEVSEYEIICIRKRKTPRGYRYDVILRG